MDMRSLVIILLILNAYNKNREIYSVTFMCTGGGFTDNKTRKKIQGNINFLCRGTLQDCNCFCHILL